jgi:hypothetical protein
MGVSSQGQKSELERLLYNLGFDTKSIKFKKILSGKAVYFSAKCGYGYEIENEKGESTQHICKRASISLVYKVLSLNKTIRLPYHIACIESIIQKDDVGEGEPYCDMCSQYIKNIAEKLKNDILKTALKPK